jgi:hypothetical protein
VALPEIDSRAQRFRGDREELQPAQRHLAQAGGRRRLALRTDGDAAEAGEKPLNQIANWILNRVLAA